MQAISCLLTFFLNFSNEARRQLIACIIYVVSRNAEILARKATNRALDVHVCWNYTREILIISSLFLSVTLSP